MMESGVEEDLLASLRLSDPQEMVDEEAVQAAAELKKLQNREKFLAERQAMQLKMAEKKILEEAERITNNPPAPPPTPTPTQTPTQTQTSTISSSSSPSLSPSSIYHTPTPLPFSSVLVDGCEQRKVGGFFGKTSFWVYKIVVNNQSFVVRRFRDIVALERRIREDVPGIILPPFPDKHSSRAMEEGHITQSFEFAQTRAGEISQYLQLLVAHPVTNSSQALKTFLTLQDDIGTAWPEVSTSTITRLTASASSSASSALSSTSSTLSSMNRNELTDSDPRMLSAVSDQLEIVTAIQQAVPKLESAAVHFREHSEVMGIVGMELQKLVKDTSKDLPLSGTQPIQILSGAVLRGGRRTKRGAVEVAAAMAPFTHQFKLGETTREAILDRKKISEKRHALSKKVEEKTIRLRVSRTSSSSNAPEIAQKLEAEQNAFKRSLFIAENLERDMGVILLSEFARVGSQRRREFLASAKTIASSMKEQANERASIWIDAMASFELFLENENE